MSHRVRAHSVDWPNNIWLKVHITKLLNIYVDICIYFGATAPQWSKASSSTRFPDAPQSVGLLWTSDQLVAEMSI